MTVEFVQSRIHCAGTLKSLAFKQKSSEWWGSTSLFGFLNRLMRNLLGLQDFELVDGVSCMSDLMEGLGTRYWERASYARQDQEPGLESFPGVKPSKEAPATLRSSTSNSSDLWHLERPSLRTLKLKLGWSLDFGAEKESLQKQFRFLDDIKFEMDHNDSCGCYFCNHDSFDFS